MCIKSHLRTASWSSGVCLGRQLDVFFLYLHVCVLCSFLFCLRKKGLSVPCRDCLLGSAFKISGNKSPDGKGGSNIRVIISGAPMAFHRANWGHRHPLQSVRKWADPGKARSRCVGGWVYSKELQRQYLSDSRGELRQDEPKPETNGAFSAPERLDSDT